MTAPTTIFWFRRDLRLHDNAGLYHALKQHARVQPIFILDTDILGALPHTADRRVDFIVQALAHLDAQLAQHGARLKVYVGTPAAAFAQVLADFSVDAVYANCDYEPAAIQRDLAVQTQLAARGIALHRFKDQVVFEKSEVTKDDGKPYTVFTPYSKKWKSKLTPFYLQPYPTLRYAANFAPAPVVDDSAFAAASEGLAARVPGESGAAPVRSGWGVPSLASIGFEKTDCIFQPPTLSASLVRNYAQQRDTPSILGTSRLGIHLRFGTGSVRTLVQQAQGLSETFLNELIWREFFQMLLWHYPQTVEQAFKPAYDAVVWRNDAEDFARWKAGKTGYPLVDAGMRELAQTGFMHNRVRMLVASFLCKHLLIDWRWGEAHFASLLLDYEQAANVGNWQWAAGCGADAAPYFRIFNPDLQAKKFDAKGLYLHQWLPEFGTEKYPSPMIEHAFARQRCLDVYKTALKSEVY